MTAESREKQRHTKREIYAISWLDSAGSTQSANVRSSDSCDGGLAFVSSVELAAGTSILITAQDSSAAFRAIVRHCSLDGGDYVIGLELEEPRRASNTGADAENLYDFLQISPSAQQGTIHRVFRYLAGLYHPDNLETGDPERFLQLNRAYGVLSDPKLRATYDAELNRSEEKPSPAFVGIDFMDGIEGELNRRLAVLAVLYKKCRSNIHNPRVTLVELEKQMGFPRDYLDFTTWYLRSKKYISKEDNSDFALTATGVDFVEENYDKIPLLQKFLKSGWPPHGREQAENGDSPQSARPKPPLVFPIPTGASGGA